MDRSLFGPPSELIHIDDFVAQAYKVSKTRQAQANSPCKEFSVDDLKNDAEQTWNNPTVSAYISKEFNALLYSVQNPSKQVKRKKARVVLPETLPDDAKLLQKSLDNMALTSLSLDSNVISFTRTPKNSDFNVLTKPKNQSGVIVEGPQATITFSVYNRISWNPTSVTRVSQHSILSFRNLGDVYRAILCPHKTLPSPIGGDLPEVTDIGSSGAVMCIEGIIYGDQVESELSYCRKLAQHLESISKAKKSVTKASTTFDETRLSSLSMRVGQPYWIVHQGNCEHFFVIDQIGMYQTKEPFPSHIKTLHITPTLLDLCRACAKVPAVWMISNDIRLGESPCPLCRPCWRSMGPSEDPKVVAMPLPTYDYI